MTATTTIPAGAPTASAPSTSAAPRTGHGRGWAWAGVLAGAAGIGMIITSGAVVATEDALADNALVLGEVIDKEAFVWAGVGLTAGAVAVAAIRHGSLPRWIGWFSAVVAALVGLVQIVPLQYMAAFAGAPWLIVAGVGLARADRS